MRPYLTFILLLTAGRMFGQDFAYPAIVEKAASLNDFVPKGWSILDSATGDLNNDRLPDAVLVLQHNDSVLLVKNEDFADTVKTQPRILAVLFKSATDHLFHLKEQADSFILTHGNVFTDDPYQSVTIKKGILQVDFYWYPAGGNWFHSNVYKFRYQQNDFFLIGAEYEERNKATSDFNKYSYDFLMKRRVVTIGNDFRKSRRTEIQPVNIVKMQTIKTLKPYTAEVGDGIEL